MENVLDLDDIEPSKDNFRALINAQFDFIAALSKALSTAQRQQLTADLITHARMAARPPEGLHPQLLLSFAELTEPR